MTQQEARLWLVKYSLVVTIITFVFFALAPTVGYPLSLQQAIRIMEISTPVFLGYLGAGAQYLIKRHKTTEDGAPLLENESGLFSLLIKGPIVGFSISAVAVILAFYLSNRPSARVGDGMSVDTLALFMTGLLGMLTVTTNVLASFIFNTPDTGRTVREMASGQVASGNG